MSYSHELKDAAGFNKQRDMLNSRANDPLTVVDVGGNRGQSVEAYLELFPQAKIHSIEPHPVPFAELQQRYAEHPTVQAECFALGAEPGRATFHAADLSEVSSLLAPDPLVVKRSVNDTYRHQEIEVEVDTLQAFAARSGIDHIDVLKLDVQGAELQVLEGAAELLREQQIDLLFVEVMFAANYSGQCYLDELWTHLKDYGYVLWDLFPFLHTRAGRLWTGNSIFVSPRLAGQLDPR